MDNMTQVLLVQAMNRAGEEDAKKKKLDFDDFELSKPEVEILSEPCESCSA